MARKPLITYPKFLASALSFGLLIGLVLSGAAFGSTGTFDPWPPLIIPVVVAALWSIIWVALEKL